MSHCASVSAAGTTRAVVSVTYVGICPSIWVNKKCHVLSACFTRYFGIKTGKGAQGFEGMNFSRFSRRDIFPSVLGPNVGELKVLVCSLCYGECCQP